MEIQINYGGLTHTHLVPIIILPLGPKQPPTNPHNYPPFLEDAVIVASLQYAAQQVADDGVRAALNEGFLAAVQAMQERAGPDVKIVVTPHDHHSRGTE